MILVLVAVPLACALVALVIPPRLALWLHAAGAFVALGFACRLAHEVQGGSIPEAAAGIFRADGLASVMAVVVTATASIAGAIGIGTFRDEEPRQGRRYAVLASALSAALLSTVLSDHLGILWIMMELSAVLGAFLVGFHGGRPELEAAFKYMILGSAGLVLGLLATALVHHAGAATLGAGDEAMSFAKLVDLGTALPPVTMKIALALAAAGYGLKVGLFPLHVWKPDAYAAAPAPVAGLLAGAAVAVPLAALLRFGALARAAGEGVFASHLFVGAGLVSVLAAMILIVREHDLRRILAFTSVEHMGLVLLACGLEPSAVRGGLFHLFTNGTLKALAFGVLGFAVRERRSADIASGPGLYGRSDALSGVFLVAMAAALGFPPFGMFTSELTLVRALFSEGHAVIGSLVLFALAAVFGVVASGTIRLVFARADEFAPEGMGRHGFAALSVGVPVLAALAWTGIALPESLWNWLGAVARGISQ